MEDHIIEVEGKKYKRIESKIVFCEECGLKGKDCDKIKGVFCWEKKGEVIKEYIFMEAK